MSELIPQRHGGALHARPPKGASNKGTSFRMLKRECRELMAGSFLSNVGLLQDRCQSQDERVSVIALQEYFRLFLGKHGDTGLAQEDATVNMDLSRLSPERRARAHELIVELQSILADRN